MAILNWHSLAFEFRYIFWAKDGMCYEYAFLWNGEPMIRSELLSPGGPEYGRRKRTPGYFEGDSYESDGLVPLLEWALSEDTAAYWQPDDPDILVAIYPDDYLPLLPWEADIWHRVGYQEIVDPEPSRPKRQTKGPKDKFTVLVMHDAGELINSSAPGYCGQGLCLNLTVTRRDLQKFRNDLKRERREVQARLKAAKARKKLKTAG